MGIGAALATALLPLEVRHENEVRGGIAIAMLALVIAVDPVHGAVKSGATGRIKSKDRATSIEAVKKLLAAGETDLTNAQLKSADLSGLKFTNVCLDYANLNGANLQKADLTGASFSGAWITNADFTEAKVNGIKHFDAANCNGVTAMPTGWECINGHPGPTQSGQAQ
jgi:hypothetical protein